VSIPPQKLLTVIPARGGSRAIPGKNIVPVAGKPMLLYTIQAALESGVSTNVVVSTDSGPIAELALSAGAQVIERPAELATDTASTEGALLHALDQMSERGDHAEFLLTLQPTSPLRKASTIVAFVRRYAEIRDRYDAMLSLTEDRSFKWLMDEEGGVVPLLAEAPRRREARTPLYTEDSALYITQVEALRRTGFILGHSAAGYVMNPLETIDVNELTDLELVEAIVEAKRRRAR